MARAPPEPPSPDSLVAMIGVFQPRHVCDPGECFASGRVLSVEYPDKHREVVSIKVSKRHIECSASSIRRPNALLRSHSGLGIAKYGTFSSTFTRPFLMPDDHQPGAIKTLQYHRQCSIIGEMATPCSSSNRFKNRACY